MKTSKLLLPYGFKRAGWWILAVGLVLALFYVIIPESVFPEDFLPRSWNDFCRLFGKAPLPRSTEFIFGGFDAESDLVLTLTGVLLLVGGVFVGFSRNRDHGSACDPHFGKPLIILGDRGIQEFSSVSVITVKNGFQLSGQVSIRVNIKNIRCDIGVGNTADQTVIFFPVF